MFTIEDLTDGQITEFFINDPLLCYIGLPDNELAALYYTKKFVPDVQSIFKGIFNGKNELICIVRYEQYTTIAVAVHFYLSSKEQKKGIALEIQKFLYDYFIETTDMLKVITMVPSSCEHVIKCAETFGMKLEGRLTKSIVWREEIVDLLCYGLELKRG